METGENQHRNSRKERRQSKKKAGVTHFAYRTRSDIAPLRGDGISSMKGMYNRRRKAKQRNALAYKRTPVEMAKASAKRHQRLIKSAAKAAKA